MIKNTFNKLKIYFKARREFKNEYKEFYSSIPEKFKNRLEIKNIIFILAILLSFFSGLRFSSIITSYDDNSFSSSIIVDNKKHEVFKNEDGSYTGQTYIFGGVDSEDDNDLIGNTGFVSFSGEQVASNTLTVNLNSTNVISSSDSNVFYTFDLNNLFRKYSTFKSYFDSNPNIDKYFICYYMPFNSESPRAYYIAKSDNRFTFNVLIYYEESQFLSYTFGDFSAYGFSFVSSLSSNELYGLSSYNHVDYSFSSITYNDITYSIGNINSSIVSCCFKTFISSGSSIDFKPYLVVEYVVDYFKLYTVVGGDVNSSTIYKYDYSFSFYYDWIEDEFDRYESDDSTKITLTGSEEYTLFSWYDTFSITLNTIFNVDSNGIIPGFRLKFEDIYDGHANPYILSFNYYASSFIPVSNISLASQVTPSCYFEFVNNGGDLLTAFYSSGGSSNANAYTAGYDEGYKFGYKDGNTIGEANGYEKGYKDANGNPIGDMIFAIADVPFKILQDFIGFNIMGFDVLQFVTGILGLLMAVFILKMFI